MFFERIISCVIFTQIELPFCSFYVGAVHIHYSEFETWEDIFSHYSIYYKLSGLVEEYNFECKLTEKGTKELKRSPFDILDSAIKESDRIIHEKEKKYFDFFSISSEIDLKEKDIRVYIHGITEPELIDYRDIINLLELGNDIRDYRQVFIDNQKTFQSNYYRIVLIYIIWDFIRDESDEEDFLDNEIPEFDEQLSYINNVLYRNYMHYVRNFEHNKRNI